MADAKCSGSLVVASGHSRNPESENSTAVSCSE